MMKIIITCSANLFIQYNVHRMTKEQNQDELKASINCQYYPSVEYNKLFVSSLTLDCPRFPDFTEADTSTLETKNDKRELSICLPFEQNL